MKRLLTEDASKEELIKVFKELKKHLLRVGYEEKKKRTQWEAMELYGWGENDWGKLEKGQFRLPNYQRKMKIMLKGQRRTPYYNEKGKIVLERSNPLLSEVLERWETDDKGATSYHRYYVGGHRKKVGAPPGGGAEIRQAILAINYNREECSLFFFKTKAEREKELGNLMDDALLKNLKDKTDEWVATRFRGKIAHVENELHLIATQRADYNSQSKTEKETVSNQYALAVLKLTKHKTQLKGVVVGNFAGSGPSSGLCIIEEIGSELPLAKIFDAEVSAHFRHLLAKRTFSQYLCQHLYQPRQHEHLLNNLAPFVKKYKGHLLDNRSGKESIRVVALNIGADGKAQIDLAPGVKLYGFVLQVSENSDNGNSLSSNLVGSTFRCHLGYSKKYDSYQTLISLRVAESSEKEGEINLKGTYDGLTYGNGDTQAGRVIFRSIAMEENVQLTSISVKDQTALGALFTQDEALLPFFGGFSDDFSDRLYQMNSSLMERSLFAQVHAQLRYKRDKYIGRYLFYYPSTKGDKVYQRVLQIQNDVAYWYDEFEEAFSETFVGAVAVVNKCLSIHFNEMQRSDGKRKDIDPYPADRMLVVHIGGKAQQLAPGDGKIGKIYRQNTDDEPVMSDALIVAMDERTGKRSMESHMKTLHRKFKTAEFACAKEIKKLFTKKKKKGKNRSPSNASPNNL